MSAGVRLFAASEWSSTDWTSARLTAVGLCVLLVVAAIVGLVTVTGGAAGTVPGGDATQQSVSQENDTTPPRLHSARKLNDTAVSLLFVDDTRMNISSISEADFLTNEGRGAGVRAEPATTNATVTITLEAPIDEDVLVVGVRPDTDIQDTAGNVLDTENSTTSVRISGMDGVPPRILGTSVSDATGEPATIEFSFDEQLSSLDVAISGPTEEQLGIADFENVEGNTYVAEYVPPETGEYAVELLRMTDTSGNKADPSVRREFVADLTRPTAVMGIDFSESSKTTVTFDATSSTGNALEYDWEFGDGDTGSGPRVTHEYTPGVYTVTLVVSDGFGQSDTATLRLDLTEGIGPGSENGSEGGPSVVVDRSGSSQDSAVVSVTDALAGESFDVGSVDGAGPPLLAGEAVSLDGLSITTGANVTFSLALSSVGPDAIESAETIDGDAVGGLTAITELPADQLSTVTFSFAVSGQALADRGVDPEDVVLRREVDGRWETLETTVVEETDDGYRFRASSNGFSRFAVVATNAGTADEGGGDGDGDGGDPSFSITDSRLSADSVTVGESVQVDADVRNSGEAAGSVTIRLSVNGTTVDRREVTDLGAGETETVTFTHQFDQPGTATVEVDEEAVGRVSVDAAETPTPGTGTDQTPTPDGTPTNQSDQTNQSSATGQFEVTDVTLNATSIAPGEAVTVDANVTNTGDEQGDFTAALLVDGTVVDSRPVPKVPGGATIPVSFTHSFDEAGTYSVSINGTASESELTVGSSGGLFSFLSILPLGFLPLGLVRPLVLFVLLPVAVVYGALKGLAIYLGY